MSPRKSPPAMRRDSKAYPPRTRDVTRAAGRRTTPAARPGSAREGADLGSGGAGQARRLTFVTTNKGKVDELAAGLGPGWQVLQDARGYPEVQAETLRDVTEAGADHLLRQGLRTPFLLEDSGLFVAGLNGFPGVFSRYALDTIGCDGLLRLMAGWPARRRAAWFATDLLLVTADGRFHFEGRCDGRIAPAAAGTAGFGFDPVFVPQGSGRTFAQMTLAQKGRVSHRGQAVRRLLEWAIQTAKP